MASEQKHGNGLDNALARARETEIEPPPGFTASVMRRVMAASEGFSILTRWSRRSAAARFGNTQTSTGGNIVAKRLLIGTVGVAVILLAVAWYTGYPPLPFGTEATVGSAQRYQAKQMSDKDVVLGDPAAQAFLQSETFDRLMKNEQARDLLVRAVRNTNLHQVLLSPEVRNLLRQEELRPLFAQADLSMLLRHPDLLVALRQLDLNASIKASDIRNWLQSAEIKSYLRDADLKVLLSNADLMEALTRHDIRVFLTNPDLVAAIRQPSIAAAFADPGFVAAIRQVDLINALNANGFDAAFKAQQFEAAILNR